ncbi:Gfo/Idh/MocA family protein [Anaerotruncus rubiinfantis]|uniref:Gfo/Idh/MocA family protein n=1 Tax=Anaerotruncus rubiinfantis TaxID=1720200 RepID=UPI0008327570|nr:Gfo/Idh/MocA family oxidoreductase [Anaerotruncus rubiinfantis]
MKKVQAALIGAGDRGFHCYAPYAEENPWKLEFTAVAEMDDEKRRQFGDRFGIPQERRFKDLWELLARPKLADALLICTSDKLHYEPAIKAMEQGYHIMLEKPMSTTLSECVALEQAARGYGRMFILCFVLRYTEFFSTIRQVIDEGRIGRVNSIVHLENIPLVDQVHAFTRGIFRNEQVSCPIILAHCCHDLDLISWFAGAKCSKVASFGGLTHFNEENAPEGAPKRCLDGCPHSTDCPYYAPDYYLTEDTGWPTSTICTDMSYEARMKELENGPYGRCVYRCDNTVADNQTVIMEFENNVTASFILQPFASANGRTLKITGSRGEIRADMDKNEIELFDLLTGRKEKLLLKPSRYKYGGGDHGIMEYFVEQIARDGAGGLTCMENAIESHLIAFAAETSRREGTVVDLAKLRR